MKKHLSKLFLVLLGAFLVSGCSDAKENSSDNESSSNSSINSVLTCKYYVDVYLENLSGSYEKSNELSYEEEAEYNDIIKITPTQYEGFTFNSNKSTVQKLIEENSTFELYYKRNEYKVEVAFGSASKAVAKYEETVTIASKLSGGTYFLDEGAKATLNGNRLTVGSEDVVVKWRGNRSQIFEKDSLINSDCNFNFQTVIKNNDNVEGVFYQYNDAKINEDGATTYYLIGRNKNKFGLYLFENGKLNALKEIDVTELDYGRHTIYVSKAKLTGTIVKDGEKELFRIKDNEIETKGLTPLTKGGRYGSYSENYEFEYGSIDITKGKMNLAQAKQYLASLVVKVNCYQNTFDTTNFVSTEGYKDLDLSTLSYTKQEAEKYKDQVNSSKTIDECYEYFDAVKDFKERAVKQYVYNNTYDLVYKIHYSFLMHYANCDSVLVPDSNNVVMKRNYMEPDTRWWVPDAYKLVTDNEAPGLFEQFEIDYAKAQTIADYNALSEKYGQDLLRAICSKDCEFYFWQEYNEDPNQTYGIWDENLYTYYGGNGQDFFYQGKVFENYTWNKDYRLNKYFYGKPGSGVALTMSNLVSGLDWILKNQTVKSHKYTITLNTCGGQLETTKLVGDSSINVKLPIPTREGYEFDGWFVSRLFVGQKHTQVNSGTMQDVTLYAKWLKDGKFENPTIMPSSMFTENMVLQQNKPIKVFGTGVEGETVNVEFDDENKQTTIQNGQWEVEFAAKSASFEPKTMRIYNDSINYCFDNILIGEVWLASGQSNMEFLLSWYPAKGYEWIGKYGEFTNYDKVRIYRQYVPGIEDVGNNNGNRWSTQDRPNQAYDKSCISLLFALGLQEKLQVPVGVITSSRGGTYIEEWLSKENVEATYNTIPDADKVSLTSRYYDSMTTELFGFNVSGVVWYQGENNCDYSSEYLVQFKKLVEQWREIFNNDNLPVIYQQLVQYDYLDFSNFRLMQWDTMKEIENVYCCCGIDTGEEKDIHPADKITITARMVNIAMEFVYNQGNKSLSYSPKEAIYSNGEIVISFNEGETLKTTDGNDKISYFKIETSNGQIKNAEAKLVNNTITIQCTDDVSKVYYAKGAYLGEITLFGDNDCPVAPFVLSVNKN